MALSSTPPHNVALAHDYLTQRGGAERVVLALCRAFPDAPVYTSLYDPATTFPEFRDRDVRPLWLDRARLLRERHRLALPLLPLAFGSTRIDADVVVCSSSGWAHGIRTDGRKIVYCHSPAKWLYRRDDYLGDRPSAAARLGLRLLDPYLRAFDRRAARSADTYIANSTYVREQIRAAYGIDAEVLHPPASLDPDGPAEPVPGIEPGFLLTVARLLPYKHVAETVDAFRLLPEQRLVVVGDGPEAAALRSSLPGNVRLLGEVSDARLRWLYARCVGLVAASREDFGLTPVEAAAFGKPVAALRWGGYLDTVVPDVTGVLFERPTHSEIAEGVQRSPRARVARGRDPGTCGDVLRGTLRRAAHTDRLVGATPPWPRPEYPHHVGSEGMTGQGVAPDVRSRAEEIVGEPLLVAAASLVVERAAADAVVMLRGAGIRAILLKGPPQQEWLAAADPPRSSVDVDLFVDPAQAHAAGQALFDLGYRVVPEVTPGVGHHAVVWTAPGHVPVEVHDRLWGTRGDEWEVLNRETETVMVAGDVSGGAERGCAMPRRRAPRRASWGRQGRHALRLGAGSRDRGPVVLGARGEPRARGGWGSSLRRGARPRSRRRAAPCGPRPRRAGSEQRPGSGHSHADRRRCRLLLVLPAERAAGARALRVAKARPSGRLHALQAPLCPPWTSPAVRGLSLSAVLARPLGNSRSFSNGAGFARQPERASTRPSETT